MSEGWTLSKSTKNMPGLLGDPWSLPGECRHGLLVWRWSKEELWCCHRRPAPTLFLSFWRHDFEIEPRLALNSCYSCLLLLSAEKAGMHHCAQLSIRASDWLSLPSHIFVYFYTNGLGIDIFKFSETLSTEGRQANASRCIKLIERANSVPLGIHRINSSKPISIEGWYLPHYSHGEHLDHHPQNLNSTLNTTRRNP